MLVVDDTSSLEVVVSPPEPEVVVASSMPEVVVVASSVPEVVGVPSLVSGVRPSVVVVALQPAINASTSISTAAALRVVIARLLILQPSLPCQERRRGASLALGFPHLRANATWVSEQRRDGGS